MIFKAQGVSPIQPNTTISLRCPSCRQRGTFEQLGNANDVDLISEGKSVRAGQRRCPNPNCYAHIFFIHQNDKVLVSYPAERIDFDATDIPASVLESIEEAITCHANRCFIASAIMVRKTLEELCHDRGATGSNLKERIKKLGAKVVLPHELLAGLDNLRLLGNDAAHIESQHYQTVGQDEVEIAIEVTKEVLKAVYQYNALVKKLRSLKKPTP